jgi:hypothetical protein
VAADGETLTFTAIPSLERLGPPMRLDSVDAPRFTLSNDGTLVARSGLQSGVSQIEIIDRATGSPSRPPIILRSGQPQVEAMAIAPDNQQLTFVDQQGAIGTIDLETGEITEHVYSGSPGAARTINYSVDGHQLIGITQTGAIQWWDVPSHQAIGPPVSLAAGESGVVPFDITDLQYRHIVVATSEGLRRWNFDFSTWPAIACERAGRNLTAAEWSRYMPADEPYHVTCSQYPSGQ